MCRLGDEYDEGADVMGTAREASPQENAHPRISSLTDRKSVV